MPVTLGLASSHAPGMFEPAKMWPTVYASIPEPMRSSQPASALLETPEVIAEYVARIDSAFETLRNAIAAAKPRALIVIGDDQGDMFSPAAIPTLAMFTGETLWGLDGTHYRPREKRSRIHFRCDSELARHLGSELVREGFDMTLCEKFLPLGDPDSGVSHMVAQPVPRLLRELDIPIIPIFLNEYFPPIPSAQRCLDFGLALRRILDEVSEPTAIYASGGLSHDPMGPRAGWVDEPLDNWFLGRLVANDVKALSHLFTFDSSTLRGGTGEIRAWISVAAAMNRHAQIVDYFPAHHVKTGLGFALWPEI